jgi:hypothetical protein
VDLGLSLKERKEIILPLTHSVLSEHLIAEHALCSDQTGSYQQAYSDKGSHRDKANNFFFSVLEFELRPTP